MPRLSPLERVIESVAAKVSPTAEEAAGERAFAERVIAKLSSALPDAKITFIGSAARDTGLRGSRDIDIFAAFDRKLDEERIVARTFAAAKRAVRAKWVKHYAEHPYLQCEKDGFELEVIPCFDISKGGKLKSAVDRSPLHMAYLQSRLTFEQRRDVRVLKQLLKSAGIYGAEARTAGFSGFVCELLVLNYRSLEGLLQAASKWKPAVVVDIDGAYYQDDAAAVRAFPGCSLIVIDPTDKDRNAAAAISADNAARFCGLARAVLSNPSEKTFFAKPVRRTRAQVLSALSGRKTGFLCLRCRAPKVVEDIFYPQLKKTHSALCGFLSRKGFVPLGGAYFADSEHAYLFVELAYEKPCRVRVHSGPSPFDAESVARFVAARRRKAARGPFVLDGRVILETIEDISALACAREFASNPVAGGVASHFARPIRSAKIFEGCRPAVGCVSDGAFFNLSSYAFKAESWL